MKALVKKIIGKETVRAYHAVRSHATARLYGKPGSDLTVIAITGTNGKTTTTHLVASIFEAAGFRVALLSTIRFRVAGKEWVNETKMTVPDPGSFNRFLAQTKRAECTHLIMEATSIALDQQRLAGLSIDTGVLTNITHDHLDYHGTFDEYVQAKRRLFARDLRLSVVNMDDPNGAEFASERASIHLNYSLEAQKQNTVRAGDIRTSEQGTTFTCLLPDGTPGPRISTELLGQFNLANILASVAVGLGHGISYEHIEQAIARTAKVPGRMDELQMGQDFRVIIDYAHTPDALEQLYAALLPLKTGKIISVLGATGDRDKTKRPVMGAIVGKHADVAVITNEDPWTEDPETIMNSVAEGIARGDAAKREGESWWRILDRRAAIQKALSIARSGDIVTITGKGAETGMGIGRKIVPWSDRAVAEEELKRIVHNGEGDVRKHGTENVTSRSHQGK